MVLRNVDSYQSHTVTSQKTAFFIITAMKASNFTYLSIFTHNFISPNKRYEMMGVINK
jgi:hypothetical protein